MTRAVGCDLSRYNVSFDPGLASERIDFAFQKATQGTAYIDLEYENIWQGVKQIDVRGAYHYQNGESWTAQADHFLRTAEKHDYHIHALDLEEYGNVYNDTFFADAKRIVDRWRAMSENKAVIYTNGSTYDRLYLALVRLYGEAGGLWLDATPLWIASPALAGLPILPKYRTNKDWLIHQYKWNGLPSRWGTGGNRVDENVFCGDYSTFSAYFKLGSVTPPPEPGEPMPVNLIIRGDVLGDLNIRAGAGTDHQIVGELHKGDKIEAFENTYQWLHLSSVNNYPVVGQWASAGSMKQYIAWDWFQVDEPPPPPEPVYPPRVGLTFDGETIKWYVPE